MHFFLQESIYLAAAGKINQHIANWTKQITDEGREPNKGDKPMNASCPECEAQIALAEGTVEGEIIVCPDCAAELEVVSVNPPELALAPEVGEDWGE